MCHIFFIHSSVDGHLGCFHVLAIVNSAAMNTVVHDFFELLFSQDICPGVGFLGEGWDREGGRETQEGGDMYTYS